MLAPLLAEFPGNATLRESRLVLEAAYGDPALALSEQAASVHGKSSDISRKRRLWYERACWRLMTPDRTIGLDQQGQQMISGRQWHGLE